MKWIYSILLIVSLLGCKEQDNSIIILSDSDFINFISDKNYSKAIIKIDSISKNNTFSDHQIALLYYEKGRVLGHLEKDIEAIGSLKKALNQFKLEDNKKLIAKTSMLLGDSNAFLSNNLLALEHVNYALNNFRSLNDKKEEAKALNSLSFIEFGLKHYKKAINNLKRASIIQSKIDNQEDLPATYNNIGFVLEQTKDYKNAKIYYKKAIDLNTKINRLNTDPLRNLGYVNFIEHNFNESTVLFLKALKIEEQTGKLSIQKDIYDLLLEVSIKEKDFENSSLYISKRDSINSILTKKENDTKIKLVKDQYKLIAKEKELKQKKHTQIKNNTIFAITLVLLLLLVLFTIQKSKNKQLKLNHEKLLLEQKVLRSQMNPHFIFNALTSIQKNLLESDILKSSSSLAKFAKLIRQNFEFTNKPLIGLDEDLEALKNYIETQQLRFEDKFNYQINIQKGLDVSFIKIPPMLLQPFVENAIEHGLKAKKEKGNLIVNVFKQKKLFRFEIIDNGIGFKEKRAKNNREHAIDIFKSRLLLRSFGEENSFKMERLENSNETKISFNLKL